MAISDDEDDWLREVDEEDILTICTETDKDEEPKSSYCSALLAGESLQTGQRMILFDSGTSHHMSSYRDHFTNFKSIVPKAITAADKHTFEAIGKGDLTILIPNGSSTTHILLRDVLYAPKMGITLVSIGKLDVAGYAALFCDKRCQIFDARKKKLGKIPLTSGLYSLRSSHAARRLFAGLAKHSEPLTMQEIHERLGHIAPDFIRQMIQDGTVTGITPERRVTVHDTPEHNGVAERLNWTLVEQVHAMMHASGMPKSL